MRLKRSKRTIIGTRTLKDKNGEDVTINLYAPFKVADDEWCCVVRVDGSIQQQTPAIGFDALQALQNALTFLSLEMDKIGNNLSWPDGAEPGEHGFLKPVFSPFGMRHQKELEAMIEQEIEKRVSTYK